MDVGPVAESIRQAMDVSSSMSGMFRQASWYRSGHGSRPPSAKEPGAPGRVGPLGRQPGPSVAGRGGAAAPPP